CAPFQPMYQPASGLLGVIPLMPEWFLVSVALAALAVLSILWRPLLVVLPMLNFTVGASLVQASLSAAKASFTSAPRSRVPRLKLRALTAFLHLLQPLARLWGRVKVGLTPRRRCTLGVALPWPRMFSNWSEHWQAPDTRLQSIKAALEAEGATVLTGGDYDRWDLEVQGGMLGTVRILMAVEEYGAGRQRARFRSWPRCAPGGLVLALLSAALTTGATLDQAWAVAAILGGVTVTLALRMFQKCAAATAATLHALQGGRQDHGRRP